MPAATVAGISGRHLARPAGQGVADGLPSPSRVASSAARIFSRRDKVLVGLLEELERVGVAFRSATEPIDTSTPTGDREKP
jgi:hypothetical protein